MNKLKFAFFGTPDIASNTLDILLNNGYIPSVIITSPDKESGRGMNMHESSVSIWAKENNIPCLKPEKIDQNFIDKFKKLNIDLSIVVAYGKILPETLINISKLGTINIHYSLLPLYRGASPLESTLLNGDDVTGVSIQQMEFKLDSGPIIAHKEIPININCTKDDLKNQLIKWGGNLLCEIIPDIINKKINPKKQNESEATYCKKIKKGDGEIDLQGNAIKNYNKYRAFYGWPGIYFFTEKHNKKIRIKINTAIYKGNQFIIKRVTPEGKKEIPYEDFLRQN
jgi:methionyl-tRNA formyltransferase